MSTVLHLNLKGEYFDDIAAGRKKFEYRLMTPYWTKRLDGRSCDGIEIARGYPKRGDKKRRLRRPWNGVEVHTITHKHFGKNPVNVYAIRVNP